MNHSAANGHIRAALEGLPSVDTECAAAVSARAAQILRPTGALARLDDVAAWLAGWQGRTAPEATHVSALIFAADHGVTAEGVSAYPAHLTAEMVRVFEAGKGSVNALARAAGATVAVIDVGVGRPTGNFAVEPAMSSERCIEAFDAGRRAVSDRLQRGPLDVLIVGEMGIGNTTVAAAVAAAVFGGSAVDWVGRGTGVDDEGLARKCRVIDDALGRIATVIDPLERMAHVGGAELVAMAGAVVEARHRSVPVLLDGYVCAAALAPLHSVDPAVLDHCHAGHVSAEPGHRRVLDRFGMVPLLDLGLRLGEASGAMAALPLLRAACAVVNEVPTFAEWFGEA